MMFGPPQDDSRCPSCGCDVEVIGPPGPRHAAGCPHAEAPASEGEFEVRDFEDGDFARPVVTRRPGIAPGSCTRADCCQLAATEDQR